MIAASDISSMTFHPFFERKIKQKYTHLYTIQDPGRDRNIQRSNQTQCQQKSSKEFSNLERVDDGMRINFRRCKQTLNSYLHSALFGAKTGI